jgi:RNA polymerase sigma factor for flagellar operon FliA
MKHLPLVKVVATGIRRKLPAHVDLDDLVQAGAVGLLDAARKYDTGKKVLFETYAKYRIRGAILDSLRKADWASRGLRKQQKEIEAVTRALAAEFGRTPTDVEVAARLGIDLKRLRKLLSHLRALGAEHQKGATEVAIRGEASEDPQRRPDRIYATSRLQELLVSAMAALPYRSRSIIELYYRQELTMREIGNRFGINESRVSQIHKKSLDLMGATLRSRGISSSAAL